MLSSLIKEIEKEYLNAFKREYEQCMTLHLRASSNGNKKEADFWLEEAMLVKDSINKKNWRLNANIG